MGILEQWPLHTQYSGRPSSEETVGDGDENEQMNNMHLARSVQEQSRTTTQHFQETEMNLRKRKDVTL